MASSNRLRMQDWRTIVRLAGECRDLGDSPDAWRLHFAERVGRWVSGDLCYFGEMSHCSTLQPNDLGVTDWGWEAGFDRTSWLPMVQQFREESKCVRTVSAYLERLLAEEGLCLSRTAFLHDREWESSSDAQISRAIGTDHAAFCFLRIPGTPEHHSVLQFHRGQDSPDFRERDLAFVREAHAALAPLIGNALARFSEPSPNQLPPRYRRVLACILEGDGDKQIAARLGVSPYTVNEYAKGIFRHFQVNGRSELLARWIRRGWGRTMAWNE
ncbi:MAG: helix-turn-helix transcriptional regulator [Isosphaeraceae bacterium]